MDEKKIEEAARKRLYAFRKANPDGYSSSIIDIESDCLDNFKAGAHWAIQEFLKDLWHPAGEEPEGYEQWILVQYKYGGFSSVFQIKEIKFWKHFVEKISIKHWCYIDDLLEQKGGEK